MLNIPHSDKQSRRKASTTRQLHSGTLCLNATSSRKRELKAQAEVLRRGRVTVRREQRGISLPVVIETHRKQTRECIVGRE